jgi:hypothetical protein
MTMTGDSGKGADGGGGDSGGGGTDSSSGDAGNGPACSSLPGTKIYIQSGDTQETLLDSLGRTLRDEANITLVFQLTGSCTLTPALYDSTPLPVNTQMLYIPSTAENPSWVYSDPENTCNITAPQVPDLGIAALFPSSCTGAGTMPSDEAQWIGPAQAYTFVVSNATFMNGLNSIGEEEAYYAFGFGAMNPVTYNGMPDNWNDPTQFYLRPTSKSTLVSTALNILLTPNQMVAAIADGGTADGRQLLASSGDVVTAVAQATSNKAIGILGVSVYDSNRTQGVKVMALQGYGQTNAYLPDSTETSYDKQNVRDGHYGMWSPAVFIAKGSATSGPSDPNVAYIVNTILGVPNLTPPGGFVDAGTPAIDGLGPTALAGEVPGCAMQVTRPYDGAALTSYTPTNPCTCKFLSLVTNPVLPASCTTCTSKAQCPASSLGCFNGYCETAPTLTTTDGGAGCVSSTWGPNACTNATAFPRTGYVYPAGSDGGLEPAPL